LEEHFQVLLPLVLAPDGSITFATTAEGDPYPVLLVYTSAEELPELEEDVGVYVIPYLELIMDLVQGEQRWNGVIIDPDAEHSITENFELAGGHSLHSTASLREASDQVDPEMN